jgi:hypothetical protein
VLMLLLLLLQPNGSAPFCSKHSISSLSLPLSVHLLGE